MSAERDIKRTWAILALAATTMAGIALRCLRIADVPLWFDEAITLSIARWPLSSLFFDPVEQSPGLYYALVKLTGTGPSPLAARSLSLLFGSLAIPATYALARHGLGRGPSLVAAAVVALSAYAIDYSQEGRPYMMVIALLLACAIGLLRWIERRQPASLGLAIGAAILAAYSHFIGLVGAGLLLLATFPMADRVGGRSTWLYRSALALFAVAIVPEVQRSLERASLVGAMGWLQPDHVLGFLGRWSEVSLPVALAVRPWTSAGAAGTLILATVVAAFVAVTLATMRGRDWTRRHAAFVSVASALALFPLVLWLFSLTVTPVLMPRTALPGIIGMALVLAIIVERSGRAWLGVLIAATYAAALTNSGTIRPRDQWDAVARLLDRAIAPGDWIVVRPDWQAAALMQAWDGPQAPVLIAYRDSLHRLPNWRRESASAIYYKSVLRPAVQGLPAAPARVVASPRRLWIVSAGGQSDALQRWVGAEPRSVLRLPKGADSEAIIVSVVEPSNPTVPVVPPPR